jgi:hypothetical protein
LDSSRSALEVKAIIDAGRRYLILEQSSDGSWPETTRPAGDESYAHRVSTSAWATLALLQTASRARNVSQVITQEDAK